DGDGVPDAVVGSYDKKLHAVNGRTGRALWAYEPGGQIYSNPALGDLDGDGVPDAVVGSYDKKLHAVSGRTGRALWAYETEGWVRSSPALGDLDGDGVPDAVVGSWDEKLHAVSGRTGRAIWAHDTGGEVRSRPALADLDGDGRPEIVVVVGSTLYAIVPPQGTPPIWNPGLGTAGTAAQALLFTLDRDPTAADRFLDHFPRHEAAGRVHLARVHARRLAGDLAGAKADLEAARARGLRSVDLYREILAVAPEWELPKDDPRLAIAAGMEGAGTGLPEHDPDLAPLDADVLGAAAFQAYRAGAFGAALSHLGRYFSAIHREADGAPWLARARFFAALRPDLSAGDLGLLVQSNTETLAAMDSSDRSRIERAMEAWKEKHPGETPPALPWSE
ncbi:MAG: PQQ-binding-like beta-propeller repeat protein, partial [Planctomycetes bacterium]|nr:PQQ-binding-like beta-propeller repeat protein [Planctomycetota bacterium]